MAAVAGPFTAYRASGDPLRLQAMISLIVRVKGSVGVYFGSI